jgi:hypothetical protein
MMLFTLAVRVAILQPNPPSKMTVSIFGICEDYNGNVWFGFSDGVYRNDGINIIIFKNKDAEQ